MWFRQDLRLNDNPALLEAARSGAVIPLFIYDEESENPDKMGASSRLWLYHSLKALNASLGGKLVLRMGRPDKILRELLAGADCVFWNRCYEPSVISRDQKLKAEFGTRAKSFNANLLWEPWEVRKADGTPYRVFTPFYKKGCLQAPAPRKPLAAPQLEIVDYPHNETIDDLNLLQNRPWENDVIRHWRPGENGAWLRLERFLSEGLSHYAKGRDVPSQPWVTRLSPYLHFGEISPHQIWSALDDFSQDDNVEKLRAELAWREFSYHLLYHFPHITRRNFQDKFANFPWEYDEARLRLWQKGQTGIPIVDAGMRELWHTGYMHNRVRMIVASFLTKNLRLHWRHGFEWFWDTLVDADLANNAASWQWVAGTGADAAPYFRVFNPVLQAKKFDPNGAYIRAWVPELAKADENSLFAPWEKGGVKGYTAPIVDLAQSARAYKDTAF